MGSGCARAHCAAGALVAQVESQAVLRAGSVVPPGCLIPSGQLWEGNPAKFVRNLTPDEACARRRLEF